MAGIKDCGQELEVHKQNTRTGQRETRTIKTHEGAWKQVKTIRDQGRRQTGDTKGRASDLKQRRVTFKNKP